MAKRQSWREVIDKRRKDNFVGRSDYLRMFSDNFTIDVPTFVLFSVVGEGGVGKSTLLKQYESIASSNSDTIVVGCDEEQISPALAMGHVAETLGKLGIRNNTFDERYKTYRARREEIESDPKAPRGALNLVVRGMTDFAIKSARRAPGVGVFAEYVDAKEAGDALAQGVNYLIDRIGNKDEVQLLRDPENILTPLFIQLLDMACENHRVVLMFDVFERTREALEPWLLEFLNFKYGEFDTSLTFVISGRDPLDQRWTQIASSICHVSLEPFTTEETRLYLSNRLITDAQLVTQIHEDTGGLPVLVELLAGTNPKPGIPLPDISKDAVKRFLQWITEEERRRVALLAAVPREFNRDILGAALGKDATIDFAWLSTQSYIRTSATRGWFYHEKVRELMLRYLHNTMPSDLIATHEKLSQFFENQENQLGLIEKGAYDSEAWRKFEVEHIYHLFSAHPERNLSKIINAFLIAFRWRWRFGEIIAKACQQTGHETSSQDAQHSANTIAEFYQAYNKDEHDKFILLSNAFIKRDNLAPIAQSALFSYRGQAYSDLKKHEQALAEFDRAIAIDEKYSWAIAQRGLTYLRMNKYEQALADYDRAITLEENSAPIFANRGLTYARMGKHEQALADYNRAVTLDEKNASILANRGDTFRELGEYKEALSDFDRAVILDEKNHVALANRGETYRMMGKYEPALADFNRAIELDNEYHWAYEQRGLVFRSLGRFQEAIESLTQAEKTGPTCSVCVAERAATYQQMGRYEEAIHDFNRALELDEKYVWVINRRGATYRALSKYHEALTDFSQTITLDVNDASAFAGRGETYRQMGKYQEALDDFDRAISLDEKYAWAIVKRGETYGDMGKYQEALTDFDRAIALNVNDVLVFANRGETYRRFGKYQEALGDLNRALVLDKENASVLASRGITYRQMGKYQEALDDSNHAIGIDSKLTSAIANRGATYREMGKYQEALTDFDRAISLNEKYAWAIANRGETYREMGKYQEALADLNQAIELDSQYHWAYEHRGIVLRSLERYEEAIESLTQAEKTHSTCPVCIAERGRVYRQMSRYEEAVRDFDRVLELDEKSWAIIERGQTYQAMGKYEEAIHDFTRALELEPENGWAVWMLGVTYRSIGEYKKSLVEFDQAIALNRDNARAYASRGETHRMMGEDTKAMADFDQAIKMDEKLDYVWAFRGDLYRKLHDYKASIRDLSKSIELDPKEDSFARSRRAAAYKAVGDLASADVDIQRVMMLEAKDASDFYYKAVVSVLMDHHVEAIELLREAMGRDSTIRINARSDDLLDPIRNLPEFQELIGLK